MNAANFGWHGQAVTHDRQRGIVLIIALVALVIISIGAIALVRSVDTSVVIAGNLSFKQSAVQVADVALEKAVAYLDPVSGLITTNGLDKGWAEGTACNWKTSASCQYYPKQLTSDFTSALKPQTSPSPSLCSHLAISPTAYPQGVPVCAMWLGVGVAIDWPSVKSYTSADDPLIPPGYSIRFVIERLCNPLSAESGTWDPSATPTDFLQDPPASKAKVETYCRVWSPETRQGGGHDVIDNTYSVNVIPVLYRVTIQVTGPRQTQTYTQAVIRQ